MADIAPFGKNVPEKVQDLEEKKQELADGNLKYLKALFTITKEIRVAEGETIAVEDLLSMDWLVKGVNGSIPE